MAADNHGPEPLAKPGKGLGLGLGLRHCHVERILAGEARVDWFEAISENYMDSHGHSLRTLKQIAERYPIALHGVSMSIGSTDAIDYHYLAKLKALCAEVRPKWVSDHLCWTGVLGFNTHDLLPLPLDEETLDHIVSRINVVQDYLERQLVLENPSTYLRFSRSTIDEADFFRELTAATGCGLLLDVNNVYVSCYNAGSDPWQYLQSFPFDHVVQMHLAGHQDNGTHVIDTHDHPVRDEVWQLFHSAWELSGGASTSLEWDGNIPSLERCEEELFRARDYMGQTPVATDYRGKPAVEPHGISTPLSFTVPDVMRHTVGELP